MKKIYTLLISILIIFSIFAQAPRSFKYQAIIRDADGDPMVNESVSIELVILQGSSSGTEVFSETHNTTTNAFGLVNLEIGSVNSTDFSAIDWATGPYYVEISLDGTSMGTSQLLSVPYALFAGNTDCCVWNKAGNNIDYMSGNVSIGTESSWAALNVGGQVSFEPGTRTWGSQLQLNASTLNQGMNYQFTSTGGNAAEGPGKLLLTNTKYGHAMVIDSTLHISMGTEANWGRLNIGGQLNIEPGDNQLWGSQLLLNSDSLNEGAVFTLTSTAGDAVEGNSKLVVGNIPFNSIAPSPIMTFDTLGNIGIGTVNPLTKLHIGEYDTYSGFGGGNREWMDIGLSMSWNTDNMYIGLKDEGEDQKTAVIAWGDNEDDELRFVYTDQDSVTENDIAVFKSTGIVGIGTVNPMANFHVAGLDDIDLARFGDQNIGSDSLVVINNKGEVGIGTSNPRTKIQVNGTLGIGNDGDLYSNMGHSIELVTDSVFGGLYGHTGVRMFAFDMNAWGTAKLGIQTSTDFQEYETSAVIGNEISYFTGNVGIGATEPTSKLQVGDGDVYVETIGTGVIIKSPDGNCWRIKVDNSGNLSTEAVGCP